MSLDINSLELLVKELYAMRSVESWNAHAKEQIQKVIGKIDTEKSGRFAEFLNHRFLDALAANNGKDIEKKWHNMSVEDKTDFAQKMIDTVLSYLKTDIMNNRVTVYTNDGEVYQSTGNPTDILFQEYACEMPKITVKESKFETMSVTRLGKININFNYPLYSAIFRCFLMDLRHEMMHVVDLFVSQISTLEPEVRKQAIRYYVSEDKDLYKGNPLEINANLKRSEFSVEMSERFGKNPLFQEAKTVNLGILSKEHVY